MRIVIFALIFAFFSSSPQTATAQPDGPEGFDLAKPITISWQANRDVSIAADTSDHMVEMGLFDPYAPNDGNSFPLASAGENDSVLWAAAPDGTSVLLAHSGFHYGHPQLLEWLRGYIQGGIPSSDKLTMRFWDGATAIRHFKAIQGLKMTLSQEGIKKTWRLHQIFEVKHELVHEFSQNVSSVIGVPMNHMSDTELQTLAAGEKIGSPLFVVTCTWGADLTQSDWGSWGRYVFIMTPINQ